MECADCQTHSTLLMRALQPRKVAMLAAATFTRSLSTDVASLTAVSAAVAPQMFARSPQVTEQHCRVAALSLQAVHQLTAFAVGLLNLDRAHLAAARQAVHCGEAQDAHLQRESRPGTIVDSECNC